MERAEKILGYMDQLQQFIELINTYIDKAMDYFATAKEWVEKIIDYIKKGVDYLVNAIGGRPDHLQIADDYLFV